jgi:hypothetical protein
MAGAVALTGVALYFGGVILWQSSTGQYYPYGCGCAFLGGEALIGATLSLVGVLMLPLAAGMGIVAAIRPPPGGPGPVGRSSRARSGSP